MYLHIIVIKRSFIVGVKSGKKINCERIIRIACMNNKPLVSHQRIDIYIYIYITRGKYKIEIYIKILRKTIRAGLCYAVSIFF